MLAIEEMQQQDQLKESIKPVQLVTKDQLKTYKTNHPECFLRSLLGIQKLAAKFKIEIPNRKFSYFRHYLKHIESLSEEYKQSTEPTLNQIIQESLPNLIIYLYKKESETIQTLLINFEKSISPLLDDRIENLKKSSKLNQKQRQDLQSELERATLVIYRG